MNENAKKWVEALRSGEFKQGKDELGGPVQGYCCLGVACVVYERETGEQIERRSSGSIGDGNQDEDLNQFPQVQEWLGLSSDSGYYTLNIAGPRESLVSQNDNGTPFTGIADIIESEPEGLFK